MSSVKHFDRGPAQWRAAVELIENIEVRARVAAIVWWDYFGGRTVRSRWDHLDVYLKHPFVPMKNILIEEGLIIVGYTPERARTRVAKSFDYEDEEKLIPKKICGPHKNLFKRKSYNNHSS